MESTWDNKYSMALVELKCSAETCTLGPGGTRWRGPALPFPQALRCSNRHIEHDHGIQFGFMEGYNKG